MAFVNLIVALLGLILLGTLIYFWRDRENRALAGDDDGEAE